MRSLALPLLLTVASAGLAQTMQAPTMGRMTAPDVGIEPMMRVPAANYVAEAGAFDDWILAACRLALSRSRSPAVLAFARRVGRDHASARRLRGSVVSGDAGLARNLAELRSAPAQRFDAMFVAAQLDVHRRVWALHSGYAADGRDTRLRRLAAATVLVEERHLRALPLRPMPY